MIDKGRLPHVACRACTFTAGLLSLALVCLVLFPRASFAGGATPTAVSPTGAAGTLVTITGPSFNNVISAHFGAVSAAFTRISGTTITATVPNGISGSVNVTVLFSGT